MCRSQAHPWGSTQGNWYVTSRLEPIDMHTALKKKVHGMDQSIGWILETLNCPNPIIEALSKDHKDQLGSDRPKTRLEWDPLPLSWDSPTLVWDPAKGKGPTIEGERESRVRNSHAIKRLHLGRNDGRSTHPNLRKQTKFTVIPVNYFTKWVEAKALATLTEVTECMWRGIVCCFGVPLRLSQ